MLVILKIPVVYLCAVVWWAVRAKPCAARAGARAGDERRRSEAGLAREPPPAPATAWASRGSCPRLPSQRCTCEGGAVIEAVHDRGRERLDTVAGLMSATAIFVGLLAATDLNLSIGGAHFTMTPIRVGVAAVVLALVAAGIGGRHHRLAMLAVGIAGASWVLGNGDRRGHRATPVLALPGTSAVNFCRRRDLRT